MSTLLGFIFTCLALIVNNLSKLKNYVQRGAVLKLGAPICRQVYFVVSYKCEYLLHSANLSNVEKSIFV